MSAVESLLGIVAARRADALIIVSDEVPSLRRGGGDEPLSMPPVAEPMVKALIGEVLGIDAQVTLDHAGAVESSYVSTAHGRFAVAVARSDSGLRLVLDRGGTKTKTPPAATAPAAATSDVEPASNSGSETVESASSDRVTNVDTSATDELLARARDLGASDVLLSCGAVPRARVDGGLVDLQRAVDTDASIMEMFGVDAAMRGRIESEGHVDLAWSSDGHRYRVNLFASTAGLAAVARVIADTPPTLASLGLPEHLTDLVGYPWGLVLVAGAAGSGKSTTLSALINHLDRTRDIHIITIEDPVELRYTPQRALIHQRELGVHVPSFEAGLRGALRESPDVILVGEMRDRATISAAMTAAETGHLVLSTIHAGNGPASVDRIIDAYPEYQQIQVRAQLASCLRAVLSQVLLRAVGGGRVAAFEKMLVVPAIANLIRENKGHQIASAIQTGRAEGLISWELCLSNLVKAGRLRFADARAAAAIPDAVTG